MMESADFSDLNDSSPGTMAHRAQLGARPSATPDVFSSDDSTESNFSGFDADAFY
jgi:hypothetical protein